MHPVVISLFTTVIVTAVAILIYNFAVYKPLTENIVELKENMLKNTINTSFLPIILSNKI